MGEFPMRIAIFGLAWCFLSCPAMAQERTYVLTLSQSEIAVIGSALGARPYIEVVKIIQSIQNQVSAADQVFGAAADKSKDDLPKEIRP